MAGQKRGPKGASGKKGGARSQKNKKNRKGGRVSVATDASPFGRGAVSEINGRIVEFLSDDIHATDNHGATGLHYACQEGQLAVVEYMLTQGADIHATDNRGFSGLMQRAKRATWPWWSICAHKGPTSML